MRLGMKRAFVAVKLAEIMPILISMAVVEDMAPWGTEKARQEKADASASFAWREKLNTQEIASKHGRLAQR